MRLPLSWVREYADIASFEVLSDRLTQAGLEVSGVDDIGGSWQNVRVAIVTAVQPHPNADRLRLVTVDLGDSKMTVVCGAPNVGTGQKVAFASVGARLAAGHNGEHVTLKAAKIRGVVSEGMVCSERELGLSENHEGILVLPADALVGRPLAEYMGDSVLDVEVTPNRPDWMSVLGVTRELAALSKLQMRVPGVKYPEADTAVGMLANVEIADPDLCSRYTATVVQGVKIGPSPRWMQRRLELCGMRPINNVVDVTNYVMLEYGQPLHAFDYNLILEGKIVVRRARKGETIVSLDGMVRELEADTLVIADKQRAVAVAGVMGGLNSEVSDKTTTVLLESASFNHASIRRTAGVLSMRSEASIRFEKGLPPELAVPALLRATQLIAETSGGIAAKGIIDVFPGKEAHGPVRLSNRELNRLLGTEIELRQTKETLELLGFACNIVDEEDIEVTVPFWRSDVSRSVDLIEEVARIVGYDQIPTTMICAPIPPYQPSPRLSVKEDLGLILIACGLQEVVNYSLTSLDNLRKSTQDFSIPGPKPVYIANPMSKEFECLRTSLRPRLLANAASNQRFEDQIGLFEIGRVYMPRERRLPEEIEMLAVVLGGSRQSVSWRTRARQADFFDIKGIAEAVFERLGLEVAYVPAEDPGLRPGRCAQVLSGTTRLGVIGEVHPRVVENFKASGPLYLAEVDLEKLLSLVSAEFKYEPLPRFPSTYRDTAVIVDMGVRYQDIFDLVRGLPLVIHVTLFDVYEGEQVPKGKKSLAFRVIFQASDHTLTDEEVDRVQQLLMDTLSDKLGAVLRT